MIRRASVLVLAAVIALVGVAAVFAYVNRVDKSSASTSGLRTALVATTSIPAGTPGAAAMKDHLFAQKQLPGVAVPADAVTDGAWLRTLVANTDIYPGEVLLKEKFSASEVASSLVIPPGEMAMSVELGDPQRVAGFVRPGSEVAVFDTFTPDGASSGVQQTRMLLARVPVVAVGPTSLRGGGDSTGASSDQADKPVTVAVLTVAVSAVDATRLAHAAETGKLYFALLTPTSRTVSTGAVSNTNLFN